MYSPQTGTTGLGRFYSKGSSVLGNSKSNVFATLEATRSQVPRTLFLVGEDKSASFQWRVAWPCKMLSDHGYVADWCLAQNVQGLFTLIEAGRYNVVLTPRAHWNNQEDADGWIKAMRGFGLAWIYELDDDGWTPEIVQRQARLYANERAKGEQQLELERLERIRLIQECDGVIVSSPTLSNVAQGYTGRPVYCVPNLIDDQWFMGRQQDAKRIVSPLTIGWSGGNRDEIDLAIVSTAWTRIATRYPDVKFVVHGTMPKLLTNAVPKERLTILGWSSFPDYPRALMNIDIACCCVAPGISFNAAKTSIKWIETTLAGAACVVSKALYGADVRDGHDALVAETVDDWENALSRLIEDTMLRRKLHRNARKTIEARHTLRKDWPVWVEALAGGLDYYQQSGHTNGVEHAVA